MQAKHYQEESNVYHCFSQLSVKGKKKNILESEVKDHLDISLKVYKKLGKKWKWEKGKNHIRADIN